MKEWEKLTLAVTTMLLIALYFWGAYDAQMIRENQIRMRYESGVYNKQQYARAVHDQTLVEMIYRPKDVLRHLKQFVRF